jgi:hypothetical protein
MCTIHGSDGRAEGSDDPLADASNWPAVYCGCRTHTEAPASATATPLRLPFFLLFFHFSFLVSPCEAFRKSKLIRKFHFALKVILVPS